MNVQGTPLYDMDKAGAAKMNGWPGHPVASITAMQGGTWQTAYVPIFDDDLEALEPQSRNALKQYLTEPHMMTKKQRDLVYLLKIKDTTAVSIKARQLDVVVNIVHFLQKYSKMKKMYKK